MNLVDGELHTHRDKHRPPSIRSIIHLAFTYRHSPSPSFTSLQAKGRESRGLWLHLPADLQLITGLATLSLFGALALDRLRTNHSMSSTTPLYLIHHLYHAHAHAHHTHTGNFSYHPVLSLSRSAKVDRGCVPSPLALFLPFCGTSGISFSHPPFPVMRSFRQPCAH